MKHEFTWFALMELGSGLRQRVKEATGKTNPSVCPVLRGGMYAALLTGLKIELDSAKADAIVDDLVDSGRTRDAWARTHPGKPFLVLIDKTEDAKLRDKWLVFPWEACEEKDESIVSTITNRIREAGTPFHANDNVSQFIEKTDEPLLLAEIEKRFEGVLSALLIDWKNDHNTQGTPKRLAKLFFTEVFGGRYTPAPAMTSFPNVKKFDDCYTSGPIDIRSSCSHHFCPVIGKAWVGVIPGEKVVGLSKFNRLIQWICERPQIQEEMAVQVADALEQALKPKGLAVVIKATHSCTTWRGVKNSTDGKMTTSIMRGAFRDKAEARAEFFSIIGNLD